MTPLVGGKAEGETSPEETEEIGPRFFFFRITKASCKPPCFGWQRSPGKLRGFGVNGNGIKALGPHTLAMWIEKDKCGEDETLPTLREHLT